MNDQEYQPPPEVKTDESRNGLMCFLDDTRECGPDCMGYVSEAVDAPSILGPQQKNCILIISAERLGRFAGNAVTLLKRSQDKADREAADKKRSVQTAIPDPKGNKA